MEGGQPSFARLAPQPLAANGLQTDGDGAMLRGHLIATPRRRGEICECRVFEAGKCP